MCLFPFWIISKDLSPNEIPAQCWLGTVDMTLAFKEQAI